MICGTINQVGVFMEYIWECMIISVKGMLGMFLWIGLSFLISVSIALCVALCKWIFGKKGKKPPYTGKPIIITGGMPNEKELNLVKPPKGEGDES